MSCQKCVQPGSPCPKNSVRDPSGGKDGAEVMIIGPATFDRAGCYSLHYSTKRDDEDVIVQRIVDCVGIPKSRWVAVADARCPIQPVNKVWAMRDMVHNCARNNRNTLIEKGAKVVLVTTHDAESIMREVFYGAYIPHERINLFGVGFVEVFRHKGYTFILAGRPSDYMRDKQYTNWYVEVVSALVKEALSG